jgi:predicted nucleotidyltransferase
MSDLLDLLPRHRAKIVAILHEQVPGVEVLAYGSRVAGRSHPGSDLDLALRSPTLEPIPTAQILALESAFHDSTIPFLIEARDWARLPERFHREIERRHVVLAPL